jgi:uncharacterized protein YyaL (SSP411 family)
MWTNRLASETSAYLLQHAHNPVDWYPWGDEAFERARTEEKPIFLSIGYAACHWCHVMERESFEDEQIAAFLNTHFVPVKVDREERPDVDAIYIQALLRITGHAGWPANLFLLPDLRPFTGATYMPPEPRYGMPSFRQILERVRDTWIRHREALDRAGGQILAHLAASDGPAGPRPGQLGYRRAVDELLRLHDDRHGGFGHDQKFPQAPILELLLLGASDGRPGAAEALRRTLAAMDDGGLQDQLGGGFHRYCVDAEWTVPHFEKMLYDNAQLLRVYARSSSLWMTLGDRDRAKADMRVVRDTVCYLLRDLRDPSGAFWSSEDADDPSGEGGFYTYTPEEAREVLAAGEPLPYGIVEGGNFEHGRTVLHATNGRPPRPVRERLLEHRNRRERPPVDKKRVVAWNGLTIGALSEAGRLFGFDEWVQAAAKCAEVVLAAKDADGGVPRVVGGRVPGTLDDHACFADGLLDLYQALPHEIRWLEEALGIVQIAVKRFWDADRGGFFTSEDRPDLVVRRKELHDGAEPSGNGRMAEVLRRLLAYGAPLDASLLDRLLGSAGNAMIGEPVATPELWGVTRAVAPPLANEKVATPLELVIAGNPSDPRVRQMLRLWNRGWRPQGIVAVISAPDPRFSLLAGKRPAADGSPLAYVCRHGACGLPAASVEELERQLS